MVRLHALEQLVNVHKGPERKYSHLCSPYGLCCNYLTATVARQEPQTVRTQMTTAMCPDSPIYKQAEATLGL